MGTGESEGDVDGGGDKFPVLSSPSLSSVRMGKEKGGVMVKRKEILISLQGRPSRGSETERELSISSSSCNGPIEGSVAHEQVSLPLPRLKKPPTVHKQRAAPMAICAVHPR